MPLTIAHFTTHSLPRVIPASTTTSALDVLLPFRIDLDDAALAITGWELAVEVDGRSWASRVRTRRLRAGLADALRERMARTGVFSFDHLWRRAIPEYQVGHRSRIDAGLAEVARLGGLHLAGNTYHGVGINDCVRDARRVVEDVVGRTAVVAVP